MMVIEKRIFDYIPQIHKIIKENRYNPVYANYYNRNANKLNSKRVKEMEVNLLMKKMDEYLTKDEAEYIENNFHNYTYNKSNVNLVQ